jgi:hypothetical protein
MSSLINIFINWLENHQQICPFKENLGFDCLGCGIQRAFILLFKGDVIESVQTYPGLIPIIILIILFVLQISFKSAKLYIILKIWFIFTSVLILSTYIFKLINL